MECESLPSPPSPAVKALDLAHRWQLDHIVEALETKLVKDHEIAFTRDWVVCDIAGLSSTNPFDAYEFMRANLFEHDLCYLRLIKALLFTVL